MNRPSSIPDPRNYILHLIAGIGRLSPFIWSLLVTPQLTVRHAAAAPSASGPSAATLPLQVLIVSGGGRRDWRGTALLLRQVLSDSGFEVRVSETPAGISAMTLAPFDVVVDDYDGPAPGGSAEHVLDAFVAAGKGLVVTHAGLGALGPPGAEAWAGLGKLTKTSWAPDARDASAASFRLLEIRPTSTNHPILRDLKPNLRTGDQPQRGFVLPSGADLLAVSDRNEPLMFAFAHGKGRVFCTALGHNLAAMQEPVFLTTFIRGTQWAASGQVALPAEIVLPGPTTNGVRALVVTGGHDHEASFYGLFDGYKDIGWAPVADSSLAFKQDIRAKYDVLVFYDFTRDLDDNGKKNLRDFVESGKGIVVLHHGILNFQKWPWWYEQVVGGLYRLERQGNVPNSTVKFGQEHWITAAGKHPVTDGLTPFHVTDETYKGLFISTNIQPLLLTDNPTSDRTVAWIGPCTTSKVIFIQLGHDHSPFRHPSYRALVHNSILWTADKLQ